MGQRIENGTSFGKAMTDLGDILKEIELRSKTFYAYAMASPVFRQKPTFLIRKWISQEGS